MIVLKFDEYNKFTDFKSVNESLQDDPDNLLRKEVVEDVKRAVSLIIANHPFFGEWLVKCRFLYDHPAVDTMATDGHNIFINSRFAASLSDDQISFVLCHEVLHPMMNHFARANNFLGTTRDQETNIRWNIAADYEINPMLVAEGMLSGDEVKNGLKGCYDEKYVTPVKMAAEEIYEKVGDETPKPPPGSQEWPVNVGDIVYDTDSEWGEVEKINADGTYVINPLTEQEAHKILGI
jgi:hypothetical protein